LGLEVIGLCHYAVYANEVDLLQKEEMKKKTIGSVLNLV
jgi:hypothetical protein